MTEISIRQPTELQITPDQSTFNQKQTSMLRHLGVKDVTQGDLAVFFHQCVRTGLDPFAKQIYMISRKSDGTTKQTIQTGIDGYRLIARRAADQAGHTFSYEDTQWCGPDGVWTDVWLSDGHPHAARVAVVRNGERYPGIALWSEYVQTKYGGGVNSMWSSRGAGQLAKCAEALALRKAFPQDLSGVYVEDEIRDDPASVRPSRGGPVSSVAAAMNAVIDQPAEVVDAVPDPAPPTNETLLDEPVDAELVPDPISDEQLTKLHATFSDRGITERDQKLDFCMGVIGHDVTSTRNLTKAEGSRVIDRLDRDGVDD